MMLNLYATLYHKRPEQRFSIYVIDVPIRDIVINGAVQSYLFAIDSRQRSFITNSKDESDSAHSRG